MAEYDPYKEPGMVNQGLYQQQYYQQPQSEVHLNYYNVEVHQTRAAHVPPTYVVVRDTSNPTWLVPMAMLIVGAFMLLFFPPLSVILWGVGALYMVYPDPTARLMGCANCGACCICSALICVAVALTIFVTVLPVILTGAAAGAASANTGS